MDLIYVGTLNPVVEGKILKRGMEFSCTAGKGAELLKKFPKEYRDEAAEKAEAKKIADEKAALAAKNKMAEPKKTK